MTRNTSAFLFDIGNVIIRFDFALAVNRIAHQCVLSVDQILPAVQLHTDLLEKGEISVEAFITAATGEIGYSGTVQEFVAAFEDIFTLNEPIVDLIDSLSEQGMPLYLLSNTNGLHVPYFTAKYPVFSKFDDAIYSHEVGCMKPDPRIFEITLERLGVEPESTVYIDDLRANCEMGGKFGLNSFCYDHTKHHELLTAISPV